MEKEKLVIAQVCKNKFAPVVEFVNEVLKSEYSPIIIGIDGMCASGKTTLGYYLKNEFDCNLFHMDDFFLQNRQRTQERLGEIGGNVDYERFKEEVVNPILNKQNVKYRPYNCSLGTIQDGEDIPFKRLNIIEGSYCQHPYLGDIYQIKIFMSISDKGQLERIKIRNGDIILERFKEEWIPKENMYFQKFKIRESSILIEN
jgi:uridine kinase